MLENLAKLLSEGKVRARTSRRGRSMGSSFLLFPFEKTMFSRPRRSGEILNFLCQLQKPIVCRAASPSWCHLGPEVALSSPMQRQRTVCSAGLHSCEIPFRLGLTYHRQGLHFDRILVLFTKGCGQDKDSLSKAGTRSDRVPVLFTKGC